MLQNTEYEEASMNRIIAVKNLKRGTNTSKSILLEMTNTFLSNVGKYVLENAKRYSIQADNNAF